MEIQVDKPATANADMFMEVQSDTPAAVNADMFMEIQYGNQQLPTCSMESQVDKTATADMFHGDSGWNL